MLEHVKDDGAAMKELHRILRPVTVQLVVSVPMNDSAETKEYGYPDPRESGQLADLREDFVDKLGSCGFNVRRVDFELTANDAARFGIIDEPFYICSRSAVSEN